MEKPHDEAGITNMTEGNHICSPTDLVCECRPAPAV